MGDISVKDISDPSIFHIQVSVDGACKRKRNPNPHCPTPLAAAAVVFMESNGNLDQYWYILPRNPWPTKNRAKLMAIIMALDISLRKYKSAVYLKDGSTLKPPHVQAPRLHFQLCSDSIYAVNCLTCRPVEWENNDWKHPDGTEIKNKDLVLWALKLLRQLRELGEIEFCQVPSTIADDLCYEAIDYQSALRERTKQGERITQVRDFEE